jgi:hypothetical protein
MILKPKRNRHLRFRATGRQAGPAMTEPEKRITLLGVVTVEPGEPIPVFDIPDADPDVLVKAIRAAEEAKVEAQLAESKRLRELFPIEDNKPNE